MIEQEGITGLLVTIIGLPGSVAMGVVGVVLVHRYPANG